MITRSMLGTMVLLGSLLSSSIGGRVHTNMSQTPTRSPFRYVIVSNEVANDGGSPPKDAYRYVEVLLDENAFSEKNLRELFRLVSKRFPKPKVLHIPVYTSLEDVETPEEREAPKMSEVRELRSSALHPQAFFLRDAEGNEWFSYNHKKGSTELETVVLKGKAP